MEKIKYDMFITKCPYKIKDKYNEIYTVGSLWEANQCKYIYASQYNPQFIFCNYKTLLDKLDRLEEVLD